MGEFRIGRSRAQHSYPDTPRGGSAAFARNSANNVEGGISIPASPTTTAMIWPVIEGGGGGPAVTSVPITPRVTGTVRIIARCEVLGNALAAPALIEARLLLDGVAIPGIVAEVTIPVDAAKSAADITLMVDWTGLALGTTVQVSMDFQAETGADASLSAVGAAIDIQELQLATG